MKTLQQKQFDFLNDTINHFNSNNRGIDQYTKQCSYKNGCAIGRHLSKKLVKTIKNYVVDDNEVYNKLPRKLKELTKEFLMDVQNLHDTEENWNEKGLSQRGKDKVNVIKAIYKL